jgi:hypothetical protein
MAMNGLRRLGVKGSWVQIPPSRRRSGAVSLLGRRPLTRPYSSEVQRIPGAEVA